MVGADDDWRVEEEENGKNHPAATQRGQSRALPNDSPSDRRSVMDSSVAVPKWRKITFYVIAGLLLLMIVGLL